MVKIKFLLVTALFLLTPVPQAQAADVWKKVYDLAKTTLADMGTDPVIVLAVTQQNNMGKSLEDIKAMDKEWISTKGVSKTMADLMSSDCARKLKRFQASAVYYLEIFVMDNQGAIVAMTNKTSDYWQADEPKFQKSFNQGNGRIVVGRVKWDQSTNIFLSHISVPVLDDLQKTIGVITFGVNIEQY